MPRVKCEYCGRYIDIKEDTCPKCGAINYNYQRTAPSTPKTIAQLQSWYVARKLPPEEVTRFFIGKDVREPRAFGIYEENGYFFVYKNKADGQRVIRYEGTDEAYAVNEIYLRLKEEILNQKTQNLKKASRQVSGSTYKKRRRPNKLLKIFLALFPILFMCPFFLIPYFMIRDIAFDPSANSFSYYLSEDQKELYYFDGYEVEEEESGYLWWKYDFDTLEWNKYALYENDERKPEGVTEGKEYSFASDVAEVLQMDYEKISIYESKNYIDAGNHFEPSSAYHYYDGKLYYYLNDGHASYAKEESQSGWYRHDEDGWTYYCDYSDKEALGEDLYYNDDEYYVYGYEIEEVLANLEGIPSNWNVSGFETTGWYEKYEAHEEAYERYWEEYEEKNDNKDSDYNWDNDSDYDWDAGSSWDSNDTDWDSDW